MTPGDATDPAPRAAHGSVLADGQNKILAACRVETTLATDQVAERELIQPDHQDQQPGRDQDQSAQPTHGAPWDESATSVSVPRERGWDAHFLAARFVSETNDFRSAAS